MIATAHDAATNETQQAHVAQEVSLARLYVLRATYLLLVIGLGALIVPEAVSHPVMSRGVIPSLLGAVWLLAFVGIKYPLEMLPLLMFELAWKSIWAVAYGLPQWSAGQLPPTFAEDAFNIGFGVILMPLVIPWGYVWRHYVKRPGARWR
jgi:Ni/Fe-hydrogenase subunit HybB-like protein